MPPKHPVPAASPSPPPITATNEAQDMLVIQDLMDTLDQLPPELTRVYSDLNELGAVLYTTLLQLQSKLNQLIQWVQDPTVGPERRFQLLQEIAEEAARYKLGADDKVRVAGGASEGIMNHQRHISNLLASSTILNSAPPSPYTQALTLSQLPLPAPSRRGQLSRAANSPFGGRGYVAAAGPSGEGGRVGDTPTKKKKSRVQQLGREDDEMSAGGRGQKVASKKRKPSNRAVSPTDSLGSTSAFASARPVEPRTARQLAAAAAAKARRNERGEDDSDADDTESRKNGAGGVGMQITQSNDSMMLDRGLGIDFAGAAGGHSREASGARGGGSANATPSQIQRGGIKDNGRSRQRTTTGNTSVVGQKRGRGDEDDEGESEIEDYGSVVNTNKKGGAAALPASNAVGGKAEGDIAEAGDGDADGNVYCICKQPGYGEMIGCDSEDCEIEWYHISCVGFDAPPEGTWICANCVERKKKTPKAKKSGKARKK